MKETVILGGGCFWCLDAAFRELNGVLNVEAGYTGGLTQNPTYDEVCSGQTNHAEVVKIDFNSDIINYRDILEVFFTLHDPTTLDRQGGDVGTQYRSIILFESEDQEVQAEQIINELNAAKIWSGTIVTELRPITVFYPAEPYHQAYFSQNPNQQYCQVVISPKLKKLREKHHALFTQTK